MAEIAEAAFQYQIALEKGEKRIVGVNCHKDSVTHDLEILRVSHEVEVEQVRGARPSADGARRGRGRRGRCERMVEVARTDGNMIESMLEALRAEATLARSATRCAPSGASTASRPASEGGRARWSTTVCRGSHRSPRSQSHTV